MSGSAWSKMPREIKDQIYSELLRGGKYVFLDPEAYFRCPSGKLHHSIPGYRPPAYTGVLLASRQTANEVQDILYGECVFSAHVCKHSARLLASPDPQMFTRIQRVELFLNLSHRPRIPYGVQTDPEKYYPEWFPIFGGSEAHRNYCRVTISYIDFGSPFHEGGNILRTLVYQQFLPASKTYVGFRTVILERGEVPPLDHWSRSRPACPQASSGPALNPLYAGAKFEAFKARLATELKPSLGPCTFYDRGDFRCLEFHPRTNKPREPGCATYIDEQDESDEEEG